MSSSIEVGINILLADPGFRKRAQTLRGKGFRLRGITDKGKDGIERDFAPVGSRIPTLDEANPDLFGYVAITASGGWETQSWSPKAYNRIDIRTYGIDDVATAALDNYVGLKFKNLSNEKVCNLFGDDREGGFEERYPIWVRKILNAYTESGPIQLSDRNTDWLSFYRTIILELTDPENIERNRQTQEAVALQQYSWSAINGNNY